MVVSVKKRQDARATKVSTEKAEEEKEIATKIADKKVLEEIAEQKKAEEKADAVRAQVQEKKVDEESVVAEEENAIRASEVRANERSDTERKMDEQQKEAEKDAAEKRSAKKEEKKKNRKDAAERTAAEKCAADKKKAEDKAAAVKKATEEKAATVAYEADKKQKAAEKDAAGQKKADDSKNHEAKRRAEERKKAEDMFEAEMKAEAAAKKGHLVISSAKSSCKRPKKLIQRAAESRVAFEVQESGVFLIRYSRVKKNHTEFMAAEGARQYILRESAVTKAYPTARVNEAYRKSDERALELIQDMLALIEAYVGLTSNSQSTHEVECYSYIDQFIIYMEDRQSGFKKTIRKQENYQLLIRHRPGPKTAMDAAQKDMLNFTKSTKGAEGKAKGMERKSMNAQKKEQRKRKGILRARQAWEQKTREDTKYRERAIKPTKKSARVSRSCKVTIRSIRVPNQRSKRNKSKYRLSMKTRMKGHHKKRIVKARGNEWTRHTKKTKEENGWWKKMNTSRLNTKRKFLKGSTDVYLLKRTIEIETD